MPIVTVRLPDRILAKLDRLVAERKRELHPIKVSRADLLRQALELGLEALERRKKRR